MTKLIFISLILVGNLTFGQESISDWKKLNESMSMKSYVENQAYEYLKFNNAVQDSISIKKIKISHEGVDTEIIIRDFSNVKNPLIVINQYPIEGLNVLEFISLSDIEKIDLYKPSDELSGIYGSLAKYGLIDVEMNNRKWRKLKRKYGRR
ncbi:MAG: hypothetical protein COB73_02950 [Flavobacteriaceae bacterium]|nr:MAG: hypothetical protein COB73_02950 [Flavobacteriaceae bacterium]